MSQFLDDLRATIRRMAWSQYEIDPSWSGFCSTKRSPAVGIVAKTLDHEVTPVYFRNSLEEQWQEGFRFGQAHFIPMEPPRFLCSHIRLGTHGVYRYCRKRDENLGLNGDTPNPMKLCDGIEWRPMNPLRNWIDGTVLLAAVYYREGFAWKYFYQVLNARVWRDGELFFENSEEIYLPNSSVHFYVILEEPA